LFAGRINLVELAKLLNVDLSQISARAAEIEKADNNCSLVLGQLIDTNYTNHIAEEINEKLQQQGQVTVGDLTRIYDLPSEFLQSVNILITLLTYSMAQQPLKSFDRFLMRVSLSDSILVTLFLY
jgi:Uncharacterized conserved protein (DUF2042).